jgi:hypothetical protein
VCVTAATEAQTDLQELRRVISEAARYAFNELTAKLTRFPLKRTESADAVESAYMSED